MHSLCVQNKQNKHLFIIRSTSHFCYLVIWHKTSLHSSFCFQIPTRKHCKSQENTVFLSSQTQRISVEAQQQECLWHVRSTLSRVAGLCLNTGKHCISDIYVSTHRLHRRSLSRWRFRSPNWSKHTSSCGCEGLGVQCPFCCVGNPNDGQPTLRASYEQLPGGVFWEALVSRSVDQPGVWDVAKDVSKQGNS